MVAPPMLLLPEPFVPARTKMHATGSATSPGGLYGCRSHAVGRCVERLPDSLACLGRLHPREKLVELAAERFELSLARRRQIPELVEREQHGLRLVVPRDDDDPAVRLLEHAAKLVLGISRG